ncbi:MAG: SulP family inorganic anion transporter [Candidatus Rifleibacteriota bacterium]
MNSLEPKLITVLREGYTGSQFVKDLLAGVVVGIVALPLAIAFAIASGVKPEQGLYTAIVAGFIISLLSGSRVQIGGPTGAFIVLVYEIVAKFGYEGLAVATMISGVILIVLGLARMGSIIQFIPYPVTVGFTSGIAVVIASGQIRDALGLKMASVPSEFLHKIHAYSETIGTYNPWAALLTLITVLIVVITPRFMPRIPGSVLALFLVTAAVKVFALPVETIGSRFGSIPSSLPMPALPNINWKMLPDLMSPAISIALLAAIESLLSAVVADGMTGGRHRSNAELIAQGVANIASPIFLGIPATGAIARTATNIKNGGRSPFAGIIHAITLLIILLAAGNLASLVPMSVLAGILLVVSYNMSEIHLFKRILQSTTKSDASVLLVTFAFTVLIDLTVAIQLGIVLAAVLFMKRMVDLAEVHSLAPSEETGQDICAADAAALSELPGDVTVYEINGPFFFGAAHKFTSMLSDSAPKILILRMRNVGALDATGLRVLETLQKNSESGGPKIVLSGVQPQPMKVIIKSGFVDVIGKENVNPNLGAAIARTKELLREMDKHNTDDGSMPEKLPQAT